MRQNSPNYRLRSGFTLIELLVVVSILLILMTMTISAVNFTLNDEKVGSAARQVQSFMEGARSRAIRAREPRGVRFFQDSELGPGIVTTMAYVAPGELWDEGTIRMERPSGDSAGLLSGAAPFAGVNSTVVAGNIDTFWWELNARQQLYPGLRIRIPNSASGSWYTVTALSPSITVAGAPPLFDPSDPYPYRIQLTPAYRDPATSPAGQQIAFSEGGPLTYALELPPRILPRQPVLLPDNTCIDGLASSNLPPTSPAGTYIDLMFSTRGTVLGSAASSGLIHFYVGEVAAARSFRDYQTETLGLTALAPGVPADELTLPGGAGEPVGRRSLVTLFTQTGSIIANPVNSQDGEDLNGNGVLDAGEDTDGDGVLDGPDGVADDPYLFAETAEDAE